MKRTTSQDSDFINLVALLDKDLKIRDGEEDHVFFSQYNRIDMIRHVVVAYHGEKPVGCGAFKEYGPSVAEIKRMYVLPEFRGKGFAPMILRELEIWAQESGFLKAILETGMKMPEAIGLYKKSGYTVTPNYGQYIGIDKSVCMEKILLPEIVFSPENMGTLYVNGQQVVTKKYWYQHNQDIFLTMLNTYSPKYWETEIMQYQLNTLQHRRAMDEGILKRMFPKNNVSVKHFEALQYADVFFSAQWVVKEGKVWAGQTFYWTLVPYANLEWMDNELAERLKNEDDRHFAVVAVGYENQEKYILYGQEELWAAKHLYRNGRLNKTLTVVFFEIAPQFDFSPLVAEVDIDTLINGETLNWTLVELCRFLKDKEGVKKLNIDQCRISLKGQKYGKLEPSEEGFVLTTFDVLTELETLSWNKFRWDDSPQLLKLLSEKNGLKKVALTDSWLSEDTLKHISKSTWEELDLTNTQINAAQLRHIANPDVFPNLKKITLRNAYGSSETLYGWDGAAGAEIAYGSEFRQATVEQIRNEFFKDRKEVEIV